MLSNQSSDHPDSESDSPDRAANDEFEILRDLLFRDDKTRLREHEAFLRELREREEIFDRRVSDVLPQAIRQHRQDPSLAEAIRPVIEESLRESIRRNPEPITSVIFPIIGPAIRRAIANAFRELSESINQVIERSFSIQGIKWRLEAWRTGRSFGDVVLAHSLVFRVEELFLIHRESGLLLQHIVNSEVALKDAQVISPMLSAIQEFVRDAFGAKPSDDLNSFEVGDRVVWVEQGPYALLAAVVRGTPPRRLRTSLQEGVEKVHRNFGRELREFHGEDSLSQDLEMSLETGRDFLDECLKSEFVTKKEPWLKPSWVLWGVLGLSGVGILFHILNKEEEPPQTGSLVHRADGLVQFVMTGTEESFLQMTQSLFNASDTELELTLEGDVLKVNGAASLDWMNHIQELHRFFPLGTLDTEGVIPEPRFVDWMREIEEIRWDGRDRAVVDRVEEILVEATAVAWTFRRRLDLYVAGPQELYENLAIQSPQTAAILFRPESESKELSFVLRVGKKAE